MKKINIGIISLAVLAVVFMGATVVHAVGNSAGRAGKIKDANHPVLTEQQKTDRKAKRTEMNTEQVALQSAIASGDYNTWKKLEEENQSKQVNILNIINESNFAKFAEMHQLMEDGKMMEAKVIADELGLFNARGMGMGMGNHGMGHGRSERPTWAGTETKDITK